MEAGEAGSVDNWTSWYSVGVTAGRAMFAIMCREDVGGAVVDLMDCAKIEGCLVAFPAFELARTTQRGCSIHLMMGDTEERDSQGLFWIDH